MPVCVSPAEKLDFKTAVLWHIFLDDKHAAFVSHVARRRAWVLVIMAVVLDCKTL